MNSLTRISRRKLYRELIIRLQTTAASTSSSEICIPNRVERGPTDILKALESAISKDYTAPHYKFHDDPFLTPLSNIQCRSFALAREAGKKAAIWIRQEHANLFQHKEADPEIKAFIPPPIYTENSKVTEETLLYEISNGNVADSITIYDLLKGEITTSTKQALLELLCFYNNTEPISTQFLEYRWYMFNSKRNVNTWISRPQINLLFEFLKKQEPAVAAAAYNALICGLAKYLSVEKAMYLYKECKENKIPVSIRGYNAILSLVPTISEGDDKQRMMIKDIYQEMFMDKIAPDIHTFNAVLNTVAFMKSNRVVVDFTRNTLADIKKFKLKPSLTTYYHVLRILSKLGDKSYNNYMQILTSLKGETFTIQDTKDMNFFVTAMDMASRQFCDREAGEMVNELLLTGDNYKFMGDNYRENAYYRAYLELILATETLENFFKLYNKLVPHVARPETSVMHSILETLQLHPATDVTQYIPNLWSHMVMFGHVDREALLKNILNLMSVHCKPPFDSLLNAQFAHIALAAWDHIQIQSSKRLQNISLPCVIMSDIALLLIRGGNFDKAMDIILWLIQSPHLVSGTMELESLNEIFELCIVHGHVPTIFVIIEYVTISNLEGAEEMALRLRDSIPLTSEQEKILSNLVGNSVLKLQLPDELSSK